MKFRFFQLGLLLFAFFMYYSAIAQADPNIELKWQNLLQQYKDGKLSVTLYADSVDALVQSNYSDPKLKDRLATYRKLIWEYDKEKWRRQQYFWFLTINAQQNGQSGRAFYYMEKRFKELDVPMYNIAMAALKIEHFQQSGVADSVLAEYKKMLPIVLAMPRRILKDSTSEGSSTQTIDQLKYMGIFFTEKKDTAAANNTLLLARNIYHAMLQRPKYKDVVKPGKALLTFFESYIHFYNGKHAIAISEMHNIWPMLIGEDSSDFTNRKYHLYEALEWMAELYTSLKNVDSARYYIHKARNMKMGVLRAEIKLMNLETELYVGTKDYMAAYEKRTAAYKLVDSLVKKQTLEIGNSMYALTAAEYSQEELAIAEKEKIRRQQMIVIISAISLTALLFLWWLIRRNNIIAKRKIENLNHATLLQIAALKGQDLTTRKKMGMDLHDDVASNLAYVITRLEVEAMDAVDKDNQQKLLNIRKMVSTVYDSVREKSHDWYAEAANEDSYSFTESINKIAAQALPDGKYVKEIEVDEQLIKNVPLPVKIEILRIVQEAITNVLKHARASVIKISLYNNKEGSTVLQIKDNGKGFDSNRQRKNGLGLQAIAQRVEGVKGQLEIKSDKQGLVIRISLPAYSY